MKPAVKAVQEWLKTCPEVDSQQGENVAFHIDYLPEDTTQFSIEDSPGDPVLQEFFSGRRKAKNYVLASRMEYSESIAQQAANSGFWDDFADWIEAQSDAHNLPDLGEGRTAERVAVTNSGYIVTSEDGTCRFQIQIRLEYYQAKGATT